MGLAVLCFSTVSASRAAGLQQLRGHVPPEVAVALLAGDVEDAKPLRLAIGLPLRHTEDLKSLIQNIYDPHSPQYHHYLTPDQFAQRFGPSPADYQKLRNFVESNGLVVVGTSPNRLLLDVAATAADARRLLHVNLHYYQRADGTQFYAPDSEPSVDLDLPLTRVSGLDNATAPHANIVVKGPADINPRSASGMKTSPSAGTGSGGDYWGSDFRNTYVPCTSQTGSGQNIALFELDTYKAANITSYENDTGIGSPSLTKVSVGTAISRPGSGEVEVELDIEMAMSMAPGASVYVYENQGNSNTELDDLLNAIANPTSPNPLCYEISSSWTWTGNYDANVPPIFQQYAAQGQSFFQAAGDLGAYVADDPQPTMPFPIAETSMLTAVGGTALTTSSSGGALGTYVSETTWNSSPGPSTTKTPAPNAVSSGGICNSGTTPIPIPTYQVPFVNGSSGASSSYRNIPDVALIADNIEIYTTIGGKSGTYSVGGTSAAAPLWAALTALINEQAASGSVGPIGLLNPVIYNLASSAATYANDFHDIADGSTNNYWFPTPTPGLQYLSVAGYDLTTGLGSPQCNLITDIVGSLVATQPTNMPTNTRTNTTTNTPTNAVVNTATQTATHTSTRTPTTTKSTTATKTATNTSTATPSTTPTGTTANTGTNTATGTTTSTFINTSTNTATGTATNRATVTSTNTALNSATNTATLTPTNTAANTATQTATNTLVNTATNTATPSATNTATSTATNTNIATATVSNTATNTSTNTVTNTSTNTATNTSTNTATSTPTNTSTNKATSSVTNTATNTSSNSATNTATNTVTATPSNTSVNTAVNTATNTGTNTVTNTATASATPTATGTATNTSTNSVTNTATVTSTNTTTNTATNSVTNTATNTASNTAVNTATQTATNTATNSATNTARNTASNTATNTATVTSSYTPTNTATSSVTNTATNTASNTATNTTTNTATVPNTNTTTNTATQTAVNTSTNTASSTATNTATPTSTNTATSSSTLTGTSTLTATNTTIGTAVNTLTATPTRTPTATLTQTSSNTPAYTSTPTLTATSTISATPTASALLISALAEPNISRNSQPIDFVIDLGGNASIQLSLYTLLGEEVFSETILGNPGVNTIVWNLKNQSLATVASGIYIYVIEVNNGSETANKTGKVMVIH